MKKLRYSLILPLFLGLVSSCGVDSTTTCTDQSSTDPACLLDSNRVPSGIGEGAAESGIPICTAEREGRIYYVAASKSFKLCSSGQNIDVNLQGPVGPAGPSGGSEAPLSRSAVVPAGESLSFEHNQNSLTPLASAYFVRNNLLRPVSEYQQAVGRKSITVTGVDRDADFKPQVIGLSNRNVAVIHGYFPEVSSKKVVMDLYSDEGELIKLAARVFPEKKTIRAIAVSNGILIVYENFSASNQYFTVISNEGRDIIGETLIGLAPAGSNIRDVKLLSDGNVVLSQKTGPTEVSVYVLNPVSGTIVSSSLNLAQVIDSRVFSAPLNGKFLVYFTETNGTPQGKVAVFANDGTVISGPILAGVDDETIFGSEAIASDRVAVVTASGSNMSSRLFDADNNLVRSKVIYAPQAGESSSPIRLGNGNWIVCSAKNEGFCVGYDREGAEVYRNGDLFSSNTDTDFAAMSALGNEGRFALVTYDKLAEAGIVNFLQAAAGRLDLEVVDANTVRVINRTVEALPIMIQVAR